MSSTNRFSPLASAFAIALVGATQLAAAAPSAYQVVDLGPSQRPLALNRHGVVVGRTSDTVGPTSMTPAPGRRSPRIGEFSTAEAVNRTGDIAGEDGSQAVRWRTRAAARPCAAWASPRPRASPTTAPSSARSRRRPRIAATPGRTAPSPTSAPWAAPEGCNAYAIDPTGPVRGRHVRAACTSARTASSTMRRACTTWARFPTAITRGCARSIGTATRRSGRTSTTPATGPPPTGTAARLIRRAGRAASRAARASRWASTRATRCWSRATTAPGTLSSSTRPHERTVTPSCRGSIQTPNGWCASAARRAGSRRPSPTTAASSARAPRGRGARLHAGAGGAVRPGGKAGLEVLSRSGSAGDSTPLGAGGNAGLGALIFSRNARRK